MRIHGWGLVALLALASACVSTGKHNALKKQLDETNATLSGQIAEKEKRLQALDTQLAELRAKGEEHQQEIKRLEVERTRLETELSGVIKDRAQLKASADEMRVALAETNRRKLEAEKRLAEFRKLLGQLRAMIDAGKLSVKIVDGRMVLALPSDVLFASGSADLSPAGLQAISEVTGILLTIPDRKLQIEGHTDNVPIRTARFPSNWELGAARAITIVKAMTSAGMNPARVSAASFGELRPAAANDTELGRGQNRRIEIVVVPDLSLLPGFEELQKAVGES
jgi:chemotaxis protein MotB